MDAGRAPRRGWTEATGTPTPSSGTASMTAAASSGVERRRDEKRFERWRGTRGKREVARTVTRTPQPGVGIVRGLLERRRRALCFGRRSWREEPRMLACRWGTVSKGLRALVELRPNLLLCPFLGGLSILSRVRFPATI
ncbi:hypothetical protein GQ600_12623 [Phytophthora cactorum]|nr:hypothetical protein GQ600_12623 [Phytophthora cactorum]